MQEETTSARGVCKKTNMNNSIAENSKAILPSADSVDLSETLCTVHDPKLASCDQKQPNSAAPSLADSVEKLNGVQAQRNLEPLGEELMHFVSQDVTGKGQACEALLSQEIGFKPHQIEVQNVVVNQSTAEVILVDEEVPANQVDVTTPTITDVASELLSLSKILVVEGVEGTEAGEKLESSPCLQNVRQNDLADGTYEPAHLQETISENFGSPTRISVPPTDTIQGALIVASTPQTILNPHATEFVRASVVSPVPLAPSQVASYIDNGDSTSTSLSAPAIMESKPFSQQLAPFRLPQIGMNFNYLMYGTSQASDVESHPPPLTDPLQPGRVLPQSWMQNTSNFETTYTEFNDEAEEATEDDDHNSMEDFLDRQSVRDDSYLEHRKNRQKSHKRDIVQWRGRGRPSGSRNRTFVDIVRTMNTRSKTID